MILGINSGLKILTLLFSFYPTYGAPYVSYYAGPQIKSMLNLFITIILYIIAGGGISVLAGCGLVLIHAHKLGKKIIALGVGVGLFGLFFYILWSATYSDMVVPGSDLVLLQLVIFGLITIADPYFIGAIIVIIGRKKLNAYEKEQKKLKKEQNQAMQNLTIVPAYEREFSCPHCGTVNPFSNKFCSKCGNYLNQGAGQDQNATFLNY